MNIKARCIHCNNITKVTKEPKNHAAVNWFVLGLFAYLIWFTIILIRS